MGWFPDQPGGLNRYFVSLFRELQRLDPSTRAVVLGPVTSGSPEVRVAAMNADPLPRRLLGFLRESRAAARTAQVVDVHFALYAWLPLVLGAWRDIPVVVHFQGPWARESLAAGETGRLRLWLKRRIERAVYRRAAQVVVLSAAFGTLLTNDYAVPAERIRVIPPGVDLETFTPGAADAARSALAIPPGAFAATTVRRLVPRMGLETLLDAWARVVAELPGAVLLVIGDGPLRTELESRAERLGIAESVRFPGRSSDLELRRAYLAADVTVVPSLTLEGFGLVVLESLACGTPVIATDAGGLPEALEGLDPSLVVAAGDAEALAARLLAAANGAQPLPPATLCRTHAERFTWARAAEQTRAVYAAAAGRQHAPAA